jgi:tetratricopeptide (TPR) repeat protein
MAQDRRSMIRAAEKMVARGKLEAAIKQYKKVLRARPDDTGTLNRVGDLYARLNRLDEAIEIFSQAAEHFVEEGFLVKAIAILKKIIRLDPTRIAVYETLADLYHRQGLRNEARSQYQVVADYFKQAGDKGKVRAIFERMVELEPNNPSHRVKLAEHYCDADMIPEAMDQYQLIASFMLQHGRVDEALSVYRGAFALSPTDLGFLTDVVLHLVDCSELEAANRLLSEAIERNPEATRVREVTGLVMQEEGHLGAGVQVREASAAGVEAELEKPADEPSLVEESARDIPVVERQPVSQEESSQVETVDASTELPFEADDSALPAAQEQSETADREEAAVAPDSSDVDDEDVVVLDLDSDATGLPFAVEARTGPPVRPPDEEIVELEIDLEELEEDISLGLEATGEAEVPSVEDLLDRLSREAEAQPPVEEASVEEIPAEVEAPIGEIVFEEAAEVEELSAAAESEGLMEVEQAVEIDSLAETPEVEEVVEAPVEAAVEVLAEDAAVEEVPVEEVAELAAETETEVAGEASEALDGEARLSEMVELPSAEELLSEAGVLVNYGLDGKAVELCERALEIDPKVGGAWGLLVDILHDSGEPLAAAEKAKRARTALGKNDQEWIEIEQRLLDNGYLVFSDRVEPPEELEPTAAEPTEEEMPLVEQTSPGWLDADSTEEQSFAKEDEIFGSEDEFFDLAAELEQELRIEEDERSGEYSPQLQEQSLEEIVEGFKRGVAETLSEEDYETHYNLGIAYREMGLTDEAIGEFQLASKAPGYLVDCCSLLGACFLEKGFPDLAIKWFERGLEAPQVTENESLGLLYDLGNIYLITGDKEVARKTFAEIYGVNSNYRDVVAKLEELKIT